MIIQEFNLNMIPDSEPVVVHVNQYDTEQGRFVIHLYNGDTPYTPSNASVLIEGRKPDGKVFAYGAAHGVSISGNTVTAPCLVQMTAMEGRTRVNLIVKENGASTGTFVFWLDVQETPINQHVPASDTEIPALVALAEEQAERSEAWAVGTKNGHPVSATDPTYDNNAKYWAEQAASSVTGVASFNGRGGSVLPMAGDYNAEQITYNQTSTVAQGLEKAVGVVKTFSQWKALPNKNTGLYWIEEGLIINDGVPYSVNPDAIVSVELGDTASQALSVGQYIWYNGAIHEVTANLAQGDTITGYIGDALSIDEILKQTRSDLTSIRAYGTKNETNSQIATGKYFYLNGVLVRAKSNIAINSPFTNGTNYEVVTAGALNELIVVEKYSATADSAGRVALPAKTGYIPISCFGRGGYITGMRTAGSTNTMTVLMTANSSDTLYITYLSTATYPE